MTERVGRWLSSLSAKYIAVCALLVAVPVICTSAYLLYSSYSDNKRALVRLQQEKAKSVAVTIERYFADRTERMQAIDARVGQRGRSRFIEEAARVGLYSLDFVANAFGKASSGYPTAYQHYLSLRSRRLINGGSANDTFPTSSRWRISSGSPW